MKYDYMMIYNKFFTKQISFSDWQMQMDNFINTINPGEMTLFCDHIIDDSFLEYDSDMVMLTYLYLWMFPSRFTRESNITGADNMYLSFIKSVIDSYQEDFTKPLEVICKNFNYQIYKRGNIYIIFNVTESDIVIPLPSELKNKTSYCINCGDEVDFSDTVELYPYGFYLIEK